MHTKSCLSIGHLPKLEILTKVMESYGTAPPGFSVPAHVLAMSRNMKLSTHTLYLRAIHRKEDTTQH